MLLAGSGMFVRTLRNLETQDVGFRADHVLLVQNVSERGYRPGTCPSSSPDSWSVSQVSQASHPQVWQSEERSAPSEASSSRSKDLQARDRLNADWVGPDYVRTAGMTLIAGRDFSLADDDRGQKVRDRQPDDGPPVLR